MARVGGDVQLAGWRVSGGRAAVRRGDGSARNRSEGATELGFPGPTLGQMQSEAARRAGEPSGHGKEAASQGLGGHDLLAQADVRCPACQVVCDHLHRQPGAVGGEAARGEMVEPHAVLEVSDGVLDLGVAAMVGLQFQGFPLPVGDAAVIAVGGKEGPVGNRAWACTRRTMSRTGAASGSVLEGDVDGLRHSRRRRPSSRESASSQSSGMASMIFRRRALLADGDGVAHIHLAADGRRWRGCRSRCQPAP